MIKLLYAKKSLEYGIYFVVVGDKEIILWDTEFQGDIDSTILKQLENNINLLTISRSQPWEENKNI